MSLYPLELSAPNKSVCVDMSLCCGFCVHTGLQLSAFGPTVSSLSVCALPTCWFFFLPPLLKQHSNKWHPPSSSPPRCQHWCCHGNSDCDLDPSLFSPFFFFFSLSSYVPKAICIAFPLNAKAITQTPIGNVTGSVWPRIWSLTAVTSNIFHFHVKGSPLGDASFTFRGNSK